MHASLTSKIPWSQEKRGLCKWVVLMECLYTMSHQTTNETQLKVHVQTHQLIIHNAKNWLVMPVYGTGTDHCTQSHQTPFLLKLRDMACETIHVLWYKVSSRLFTGSNRSRSLNPQRITSEPLTQSLIQWLYDAIVSVQVSQGQS